MEKVINIIVKILKGMLQQILKQVDQPVATSPTSALSPIIPPTGENQVSFERLDKFTVTPRSIEGEGAAIVGKPPMFGKEKWKEEVSNAPIIYAGVVEANNMLFAPGKEQFKAAVLVFAEDEKHWRDIEWIKKTLNTIDDVRDSDNVPQDARKFISELRDEESGFCMELPASLSDGANAWVTVHKFENQTDLPKSYIPDDRILPFLLVEAKSAWSDGIRLIPGVCYDK